MASFKRYVAANLAEDAVREKVTVLRADPEPGWRRRSTTDCWVPGPTRAPDAPADLGVRHGVVALPAHVRAAGAQHGPASWTASHVEAFAFFGGCSARLVPDNLKTGVDKPDLYDPNLNRAYGELAAHYGVLIDPARARKPKDKPRVERQMPYIRDSWWKG
jgi:hypothetical protein